MSAPPRISLIPLAAMLASGMAFAGPSAAAERVELPQLTNTELTNAIRAYEDLSRLPPGDERREHVVGRVDRALEGVLAPGEELVRRLEAVLPHADRLRPEPNPDFHDVLGKRVAAAVLAIEDDELDELAMLLKGLWTGERERRRTVPRGDNAVARMLLAEQLGPLLSKTSQKAYVVNVVFELVQREVEWIEPVAPKPVPVRTAIKLIGGASPESPTLFPVLDAVELVYDFAFSRERPGDFLERFVAVLIDCLGKLEVRVRGPGGKVLDIEDDRAVSQFRGWYRISRILHKWTGENEYVWSEDWDKFWKIYYGKEKAQDDFDFVAARNRQLGVVVEGLGTQRVREKKARFFGVENKSSRFLIIVDVSSSMEDNKDGINRLAGLKRETIRFITMLQPGVHYNILPFGSECDIGRSLSGGHGLVAKRASRGRIDRPTLDWIRNLKASGMTRVDLAFRAAFAAPSSAAAKKGDFRPAFQEIYFITDGSPTYKDGKVLTGPDTKRLLSLIRALNKRHKVIVNTFAFPRMASFFVRSLAAEPGQMKIIRDKDMQPDG